MPDDFEDQFVLKEYDYIASSLAKNREKGVLRFNLYVGIIGGSLVFLGIKGETGISTRVETVGLAANNETIWLISLMFMFLSIVGVLLLLTLIRRSISTERHLNALNRLRSVTVRKHAALKSIVPCGSYPFEQFKTEYYKNEPSAIKLVWRSLWRRAHYGDLLENIAVINCLVWAAFITWFMHIVWLEARPLWPGMFVGAITMAWLWVLQMMVISYLHTKEISGFQYREGIYRLSVFWLIFFLGSAVIFWLGIWGDRCIGGDEPAGWVCRNSRSLVEIVKSLDRKLLGETPAWHGLDSVDTQIYVVAEV